MNIGKKNQFWDEHFYLMILPVLPIILWWFRRGYLFACSSSFHSRFSIEAAGFKIILKIQKSLENKHWMTAIMKQRSRHFGSLQKRSCLLRAGNFAEAEKMFRQSSRADVACDAAYNLGNTLVQQQKLKEAIAAYEDVLKKWSDHTKAKRILSL